MNFKSGLRHILYIGFLVFAFAASAQPGNEQLARQYLENKEYEKAADLYEDLTQKNQSDLGLYDQYLTCLLMSKQQEKAEKLVNKRKKKFPEIIQYRVDEAYLMEKKGQVPEAEKLYKRVADMPKNELQPFYAAAEAFRRRSKYQWAI